MSSDPIIWSALTPEARAKIIDDHRKWRRGKPGGVRAILSGAILRGAILRDADLSGADLTDAVLTGAVLSGADLTDAVLTDAVLTGAILTGAVLSCEVPILPRLDSQILAAVTDGRGSLKMDAWHTCETTHCRAGWAITLAGEAGRELEERYSSSVAGALIYHASTGRVPDFYAADEVALADIRECAARESATS